MVHMATAAKQQAQNPLILRCHRLIDAFGKSDDEKDYYIDRMEGFIIYSDLDKPQEELDALEKELQKNPDRYCMIPKLSFYETKKIMEGFVNEKVYDIDIKEKLLDIIQSKEARENFLEFIYDHHSEFEKWQQYYQERSRIRIIEWLRQNHFHFVFEEDLDLPRSLIEKLKQSLFQSKVGKDIVNARKTLVAKAKTYYSNEALNPRPKRGRPPKQIAKPEIEPQVTIDIYTTVPQVLRPFLYTPELHPSSLFSSFSSRMEANDQFFGTRRAPVKEEETLQQKLASIRSLSSKWVESQQPKKPTESFDDELDEDEDEDDEDFDKFVEKNEVPINNKKQPLKAITKKAAIMPKSSNGAKTKPAGKPINAVKPAPKVASKSIKTAAKAPAKPATPKRVTKPATPKRLAKPAPKAKAPVKKAPPKPVKAPLRKVAQTAKPKAKRIIPIKAAPKKTVPKKTAPKKPLKSKR